MDHIKHLLMTLLMLLDKDIREEDVTFKTIGKDTTPITFTIDNINFNETKFFRKLIPILDPWGYIEKNNIRFSVMSVYSSAVSLWEGYTDEAIRLWIRNGNGPLRPLIPQLFYGKQTNMMHYIDFLKTRGYFKYVKMNNIHNQYPCPYTSPRSMAEKIAPIVGKYIPSAYDELVTKDKFILYASEKIRENIHDNTIIKPWSTQ